MKSRLAQLRSDLTFASVLLVGALALIAFAALSPQLSPVPHSPTSSWPENRS